MKQLVLATLVSLAIVTSPAILASPKPNKCPSAAALQNVKFEVTEAVYDGVWAVGVLRNQYDTEDTWTFVMDGFKAENAEDALRMGNDAVKTIRFESGPVQNEFDMWLCQYTNKEGYEAFAYTPAYDGNNAKMTLRK